MLKKEGRTLAATLLALSTGFYSTVAFALSEVSVLNPSFEQNFKYWEYEGAAKTHKDESLDGDRSGHVYDEGGIIKQRIYVQPGNKYVLKGNLNGSAEVGVIVGSKTYSKTLHSKDWSSLGARLTNRDWIPVTIPFESGPKSRMVTLYIKYANEPGSVDGFEIE